MPEKLESIGQGTFSECTNLKKITLPEEVVNLGRYAFSGCSKLSEVKLSKNLQKIGYGAFLNCEKITKIEIPKSLKTSEYYSWNKDGVFTGCTGLKAVTFEDGITKIPDNLFYNCTSIERIDIPETVTGIGSYAFYGCSGLTEMSLKKVEYIGENAFFNCSMLGQIYLTNKTTNIGKNAFYGDTKLVLYCPGYSYAMIYAMNNGIEVYLTDDLYVDGDDLVINRSNSYYTTNSTSRISSAYVSMTLKYSVKSKYYNNIKNKKISFLIPSGVELIENTLQLDGVLCTDYDIDGKNIVTIPVSGQSGTIRFSLQPMEDAVISSYASISYSRMGVTKSEVIGVVNETLPTLSIEADDYIDTDRFTVSGVAVAGKEIAIYQNDELVKNVTSNKTGNYKAEIILSAPEDGAVYHMKAVTTDMDGNQIQASTKVTYKKTVPIMEELDLYYSDHTSTNKYVLTDENANKNITFYPGAGYHFTVTFTHPENIESVNVISTRNNIRKVLKADWNETKQCFMTSGAFDGDNRNYVPGQITVEYQLSSDHTGVVPGAAVDFTEKKFTSGITDALKQSTVTVTEDTAESYESTVNLSDEMGKLANAQIKMAVKTLDKKYTGGSFTGIMGDIDTVFSYMAEGYDGKKYVATLDYSKPETWGMIISDISSGKAYEYTLDMMQDGKHLKIADWMENFNGMGQVAGYLTEYFSIQSDYDDLDRQIQKLGLDPDEKQEAIKRNKALKRDKEAFLCVSTLITAITMSGGSTLAAGMISAPLAFALLSGVIAASSSYFFNIRAANILQGGSGYKLNWSIDPSGFVYSGVTAERLENVKATLYYKADVNDKAKIWDADEYSQQNPVKTDANGAYSWDVPEGLWQVKFEKEGYKTQYSKWLEVPPPQCDIDINMIPSAAPSVEYAMLYGNYVEIGFSQYMKPETISDIVIKKASGQTLTYQTEYDKTDADDAGTVYAKKFKLYFDNYVAAEGESVRVEIPDTLENFGNISTKPAQYTAEMAKTPIILAPDHLSIRYGDTLELAAEFLNVPEKTAVSYSVQSDSVVSLCEETSSETGADGKVVVRLYGAMYGFTRLMISIPQMGISKSIDVEVGEITEIGEAAVVIAFDQAAYQLEPGSKVTIRPQIYPDSVSAEGKWEILSGEEIISMEQNIVTALNYGTARLRYSLISDETIYAECSVVILKPENTGETEPNPTPTPTPSPASKEEKEHHFEDSRVVKKASFDETGEMEQKCKNCSLVQTVTIPAVSAPQFSTDHLIYNGKNQHPEITVNDREGNQLKAGTDVMTVFPENTKNAGVYTITVSLMGNYEGVRKLTYTIIPKGTGLTKVSASSKGFTVQWKKQKMQINGYELQYSASSKFTKKTTKSIKINKKGTTRKKITKLKARKKYYVRIRTYKKVKVNGKTVYLCSGWSKAKKVKTK